MPNITTENDPSTFVVDTPHGTITIDALELAAEVASEGEGFPMKLMTPQELEAGLRDIGARRYHRLHPFHGLLHGGMCTKGQVQAWALNRYYYQAMIPVKDASLIARCDDSALRREWRSRLVDHDGDVAGDGGIARWLKLTAGLGLDRDYVTSLAGILPGTRFAVDYVKTRARTPEQQQAVLQALEFKCDVLWSMLDALHHAYVAPKHISPGAFVPEE